MAKITLNSVSNDVFSVSANETADKSSRRADIVSAGRLLFWDYHNRGSKLRAQAMNIPDLSVVRMSSDEYKTLNEKFQHEHLLYAAEIVCNNDGRTAPTTWEEFKKSSNRYYGDSNFYKVLQGIYEEVINPILPAVISDAVSIFAETVEVGFGETYQLTIGSNEIPVFQDSAWGASRSTPRNYFYAKDYTLNPQPKTAQIFAKWTQLVGNGIDFGQFFANIEAGLYAKIMGIWNAGMTAAASDTSLVPTGLTYAFSGPNWVTLANKIAALNNTSISNVIAYGGAVGLSKVLPTTVTGSTNVNMDAAIATMLGADYVKAGYLGEYMSVRLMPIADAVVPGTQNGNVTTIVDQNKIWLMAANGRRPMTIAFNAETPITLEIDPSKSGDMQMGINMTVALDTVSVFSPRVGLITIS